MVPEILQGVTFCVVTTLCKINDILCTYDGPKGVVFSGILARGGEEWMELEEYDFD